MKISRNYKTDYAIRAAAYLGRLGPGERAKSRSIAAAMSIPERFLPQVMATLVRAGIVSSVAGPGGGYALSRPATDILLFDIVEAMEGPLENERCIITGGPCSWDDACAAHPALAAARDALESSLRASTVAGISAGHPAT